MQHNIIYEDPAILVEKEESEIPWLKIFTKAPYRELTDMPKDLRDKIWDVYYIIEEEMREYYKPKKINMASFANMLPRVHIHVMARFENDSYFPNPMWGEKLRKATLDLPDESEFFKRLHTKLAHNFTSLQTERRRSDVPDRRKRNQS
ncbi:HIT family protein [Sulfurimonas paralvinellae]|uniref:HIT family protein n=1 Tax=Sulfurimonas paralvinellae TaxID=317658 RepID=A0A7M1B5X4_9BACT|nr:HIT family protein [Sulfurimonas paralvinellae]